MSPKTIPSAPSVIAATPLPEGEPGFPSSSSAERGGSVRDLRSAGAGAHLPRDIPARCDRRAAAASRARPRCWPRPRCAPPARSRGACCPSSESTWKTPAELFISTSIADRPRLALDDADLVDRRRRQRVDVRQVGLQRRARAAVLHVERVGHAHDARLERQRPAAAAVADDRVQDLRGDDRALGLLVDALEQPVERVGGEEQAVRLVVDAVDRHAEVVQQAAAGDDHLGVRGRSSRGRSRSPDFTPCLCSMRNSRSAHVEDDLQVHPRVVAHPEPLGGRLLREPARLQLGVAVGGRQERGELGVALARRVDVDRGRSPRSGSSAPRS